MCSVCILYTVQIMRCGLESVCVSETLLVYTVNRGFVHSCVNRIAISSVSYVGTCVAVVVLCTLFLGIASVHHTNYVHIHPST